MKSLLPFLLISVWGYAQTPTVLFHENFDLPSGADSVTTSYNLFNPSAPATTHLWNDTLISSLSTGQVYHVYGEQYNDIFFETQAFSTIGSNQFFLLEFEHIAKMYLANNGSIEVSKDNGLTWQNVINSNYYGNSALFNSNHYFNEGAYSNTISNQDLWKVINNIFPQSSWWVKEIFDISNLVYNTTTSTGYNNVKIRFKARFYLGAPGSTSGNMIFHAGWFIDNLKVMSNSCELIPPDITFNSNIGNCLLKPEGNLLPNSANSFEVGVKAIDPLGTVNKVELIYKVNSGSETTLLMNSLGANNYNKFIPNIFSGDSVEWYVKAFDGCNVRREPLNAGSYYSFVVDTSNYVKCGFPDCNNLPSLINTFPWSENFEGNEWVAGNNGTTFNSHRGSFPVDSNWNVVPSTHSSNNNDFAWCVTSNGPTATVNTGPSLNHTPGGSKYLFTEGSLTNFVPGTNISSTHLITPCIDLTQVSDDLIFEFYYHHYGSDINQLRIDIDTGRSNESWWNAYSKIVGETHSSATDPWKKHFISLLEFKGKIIKIRLVAQKSGMGHLADMALDDFSIFKVSARDAGLYEMNMVTRGPCSLGSSEDIKIRIMNFGADTLTEVPVAYLLNAGTIVRDTAILNLAIGDTTSFTFNTPANFSTLGAQILKAWTELPLDTVTSNDTIQQDNLFKSSITASFPIIQDFENDIPALNPNLDNGFLNHPDFILNIKDNSPIGARWMIYDKSIKFANGPIGGTNRQGKYMVLRDGSPFNVTSFAQFKSTCLNFNTLSNPVLSFKYHDYLGGTATVFIKEEGTSTWVQLASTTINNVLQDRKEAYRQISVNLSGYAGKTVEIMLEGTSSNGYDEIAVDDIFIFDKSAVDLALVSEKTGFYQGINSSLPTNLSFDIANTGGVLPFGSNYIIKGEFTNCITGNVSGSFQSAPIYTVPSPFTTSSITTNVTYSNTLTVGSYTFKMWLEINGDTINNFNDTIRRNMNIRQMDVLPYFNDFENCNDELPKQGNFLEWARAIPAKGGNMNNAHSGTYVMMLSPDNEVGRLEEILLLPTFINADTIFGEELRFWHIFNMGSGEGRVEYLKQQNWNVLPLNTEATNWTDSPYGNAAEDGFVDSPNWIKSTYPLDDLGLTQLTLRFRSNIGFSGISWLIDDMEIYVPPQNSSSPTDMFFTSAPVNGNNQIVLKVKNSGAAPLSETNFTVYVNGILQGTGNYSIASIQSQQTSLITFLSGINLTGGTNNEIKIVTSRPNNRIDAIPADDTLILNLFVPDEVSSFPYCTDFELEREFLAYNFINFSIDSNWIYGPSTKTLMGGARSGNNAWFTNKTDYGILSDQYLLSPSFQINKDSCYHLSFYHQFITETNFDGSTVEFTLDNGLSWQVLGNFGDTNWFNTPAIHSNGYKAGWSGNSSGWQKAEKLMRFFDDGKVQFRFHFASNSSINMEGWMLDDFCFENSNQGCEMVTVEEAVTDISELKLYPNPARDKMWIVSPFYIKDGAAFITDIKGKKILTIEKALIPNEPVELEINDLPPGMYFLNYTSENTSGNVKFMVQ